MILVITVLIVCVQISTEQPCSSPRINVIQYKITNERNATGHWNTQVDLKHSAGHNESGPWVLDVQHITEKCENHDNIQVLANISIPQDGTFVSRKKPGPDYELIPGLGYYKFHHQVKTWSEARDICQQESAHLAIINSQREANALLHFWVPHPKLFSDWRNDWAHIGIHDEYKEGEYVTIFGELLNSTGYAKWFSGEPNGGASQNCGVAERGTSQLGDVPCAQQLTFFCEQEL